MSVSDIIDQEVNEEAFLFQRSVRGSHHIILEADGAIG